MDFGDAVAQFGMHKGKRWRDIPPDYLQWIVRTFDHKKSIPYLAAKFVLSELSGGFPAEKPKKNSKKPKKKGGGKDSKIEYMYPGPSGYPSPHPIPDWAVIGPPDELPPWENLPSPTSLATSN